MQPEDQFQEETAQARKWFEKSVPYETVKKIERYAELLMEWNQKFNLVAASTLPNLWSRHMLDSAQLMSLIPEKSQAILDLGSGAGFPGLVLSIMGTKEIHLIESTGKKANFLRTVIEELKLDAVVHQERIEAIKGIKADVITARALSLLPELLRMTQRFTSKTTTCLFLKGKNASEELTESKKSWTFNCRKVPSITDPFGVVLVIDKIEYITRNRKNYAER